MALTSKELREEGLEEALKGSRRPRAVTPSYAAGVEYNAKLQKMLIEMRRDINTMLIPAIKSAESDYTADGWSDTIVSIFSALIAKWAGPQFTLWANELSTRFVSRAINIGRRKFARSAPGIGINLYGETPEINEYIEASTRANVSLIESIPAKHLTDIETMVMSNMRSGLRSGSIAKQLVTKFGETKARAKFIARDQTSKINADITKKRQQHAGFEYFRWIDSDDNRVRKRHEKIANTDVGFGVGVYRWDDLPLSDSGQRISPGVDYQCFPGDSEVNVFFGARKIYRHFYTGELTEIISASGKSIRCTPNHPILTDRGFKPANMIDVGDNVFHITDNGVFTGNRNAEGSDIKFSELFDSLELMFKSGESSGRLNADFHGDLTDQKIDVISVDWSLPDVFDTVLVKKFFEQFFANTDKMIVRIGKPAESNFSSMLQGMTGSPIGIISSASKILSFIRAGISHSGEHPLAAVGLLYSSLVESSNDNVPLDIEFFSDCFDTEISIEKRCNLFNRYIMLVLRFCFGIGVSETPGSKFGTQRVRGTSNYFGSSGEGISIGYERHRVVEKRVSELFSGHVYNLEMENGLYFTQSHAVSNCRCTATPLTQGMVDRAINR